MLREGMRIGSGLLAVCLASGCAHIDSGPATLETGAAGTTQTVRPHADDGAGATLSVGQGWRPSGPVRLLADDAPGPQPGVSAAHARFPGRASRLYRQVDEQPEGSRWQASVWVRAQSPVGRSVRLALRDTHGEQVLGPTLEPGSEWQRLDLALDPRLDLQAPETCRLDLTGAQPDGESGFTVSLPEPWSAFASCSDAPRRSRVQLLEDGVPLGPANAHHAAVRTDGGGAYSHWNGLLYFSTSDGSDPRSNGRRYELVLEDADVQARWTGPLELRLVAEPGAEPLELFVTEGVLEPTAG